MNQSKILPIIDPPISAFSHQVILLSILMSYEESLPWVYSNYIQLFTLNDLYSRKTRIGAGDFFYNYYGDWQLLELKTCPWIQYNQMLQKYITPIMNLNDFLRQFIDLGFYIKICIDKQYIPLYGALGVDHHQLLVYGYNDVEQEYSVADNFKDGKFGFKEIKYDVLDKAVKAVNEYDIDNNILRFVDLMSFRKCYAIFPEMFELNIAKIINDIKEYLLLNGYGDTYRKISRNYVYGIEFYNSIIEYYQKCSELLEYIDLRTISTLLDHKNLMCKRLMFMSKNNAIIDDESFIDSYENIKTKVLKARNMLIKYNLSHESHMISKVIALLNEVKESEKEVLISLLETLENS